jgi:hypothetical protein
MRVLFERYVVEIEADEDGVLQPRPGAAWRWEPARGEGRVHCDLANLADATPTQIAAFASTHGLLRRAGGPLAGFAQKEGRRELLSMGQRLGDDIATMREALDAGTPGRVDELDRALLAVLDELPEPVRQALALASSGAPPADIEAAIGDALPDPAAFSATLGARLAPYLDGTKPVPVDRAGLTRASETLEWSAALLGGTQEAPEWVNRAGGVQAALLSLLANQPESLLDPRLINARNADSVPVIETLAHETVGDWHEVAAALASWCAAVRLVRRAVDGRGLSPAEKAQLAELYRALADFDAPANLTAGELGERTRALLRAQCETLLAESGVWPVRRGSVAGLYGRALVALWTELTDEGPLVACATPGCSGSFALTRNRAYCDACQAHRRREDVRSSRAKAAGRPDTDAGGNAG